MKKNLYVAFVVFVAVLMAISFALPKGSVQADCAQSCVTPTPNIVEGPKCGFEVSAESGTAPLLVTAVNTGGNTDDAIIWDFGDGTFGNGQQVGHTYGVGTYKLQQLIKNEANVMCWQSTIIKVRVASTPVASSTSIALPVQDNNNSNSSTNITTSGDNSPVIVGDGNIINITINATPAPVAQEPVKKDLDANIGKQDSNQNQNSNTNNLTVQQSGTSTQATTQKVGKLGAFFHSVLKSLETFFHNLDEGFFPIVLVK